MTSTHPDFAGIDRATMTDADMLRHFNDNRSSRRACSTATFLELDSAARHLPLRFEIVPAFCHSQGRICQGGFLTGMVDIAMAHAAIAKGTLRLAVPTLELKISFFEAVGPGP
jgi:acyl-coenzyme A thioesterase PaaI-like protein